MFDTATEKYFDEKFKNIDEKQDAVLIKLEKNEDKIIIVEKKVDKLEDFRESHIEHHEAKEKNMKFNLEMWVIVGIFLFDKIFQYINRFFPPSP